MVLLVADWSDPLSSGRVSYLPGQRFASTSQPELGLGMVVDADESSVEIEFAATGEKLRYALGSAPIRRVKFGISDEIESWDGRSGAVVEVRENEGLLEYGIGEDVWIEEADLASHLSEERHDDALFAGRCGTTREFALRRRVLRAQEKIRANPVRGLLGAKVDLIPHQLFIAKTVAARPATRVLLADEVGLGKTIEACLIMHRRMLAGRVKRVLVLVPEALVHQWFVELLRRFNVQFSIFDEDRCRAIESGGEGSDNPFLEEQVVLASTTWMANAEGRPAQAVAAGWDMVIVDEAHHLEWSPGKVSPEYGLVKGLADATRDVLLLTATPEQLGREGHFARLQLLDRQRFSDLDEYREERGHYGEVAELVTKVIEAKTIGGALKAELEKMLKGDVPRKKDAIVDRLVDLHGTGRVMFRNVRSNLGGFPEREAHLVALEGEGASAAGFGEVLTENDPRIEWLANFLKDDPKRKVLVIGATHELAEAVIEAIQEKVLIKCAIFHEGLTLLQRDRNAAWFSEDEGARVLVCSEIGSEGRNFQFAHHVVLFDLPTRPGLVEQRIGRLDRIGQTETIRIHVPFMAGSAHEGIVRWYHEGCNAFERSLRGGSIVREHFEERIEGMRETPAAKWKKLIAETRKFVDALDERLEEGRDRLLELASFRREVAEATTEAIREEDGDKAFEQLFVDLCDQLGVAVEPLDGISISMKADTVFSGEAFPGMRDGPTPATFSRAQALEREEMSFLTPDHPVVGSSMELLLNGDTGKCAFAVWPQSRDSNLLLEAVFIIECLGAAELDLDRYLPPRVVRLLMDRHGNDLALKISGRTLDEVVKDGNASRLGGEHGQSVREIFDALWDKAHALAEAESKKVIAAAVKKADREGNEVLERLERLKAQGHPVPEAEMEAAKAESASLARALKASRVRLDSIRLVLIGDAAEEFVGAG